MNFGEKKEKNYLIKPYKKIKDIKYSTKEVKLNGLKMVL